MSEPSQAGVELAKTILAWEVAEEASAEGLADAFNRTIKHIQRHLSLYLGEQGCAAILARAHHFARQDHPFLQVVQIGSVGDSEPFPGLRQAVSGRDPREVREGIVAILAHLCDLLTRFAGADLAERLVKGSWSVDVP